MEHLPALTIAVPLVAAALVMGLSPYLSRRSFDLISIGVVAAVAAGCLYLFLSSADRLLVYWFGGWLPRNGAAIGISFAVDQFGAGMGGLAAVLTLASLVFSWRYFDSVGPLFHTLMLVFLAAMLGFCFSGDIFTIFVFFELMSITAYGLTGYKIERSSLEGALNFAVTNSIGAFFLLAGIALLYGRTGALNLAQIGRFLSSGPADALVLSSFILITVGLLVKGAVVPFHFWLPDAHAVAPTPVCVLLSGVMVELGLFGAARIYWTVFEGVLGAQEPALQVLFLTAGAATAVLGGIMCFLQRHLKRLLAFSSISHMGVALCGFALFDPAALAGTGIYLLSHGFTKGALFICAGVLLNTRSSVDEIDLRGRGRRLPVTGVVLFLGGLALAGIPISGLHTGKVIIEEAASNLGRYWMVSVMLLSSILTGGAVLRAGMRIFFGWGEEGKGLELDGATEKEKRETRGRLRASAWFFIGPALALILCAYLAGALPALNKTALSPALRFQDRVGYAASVLDGNPDRFEKSAPLPLSPTHSDRTGMIGTAGALLIALAALFRGRVNLSISRVFGLLLIPIKFLRTLQSGNLGDYVTWILIGTAFYGLLFLYRT